MAAIPNTLKWTARLHVAPPQRSPRLKGDKITLPQSALEALLAAAPVVSVQNGGPRAFTSSFDPFNPHTFAAELQARDHLLDRQQQLPQPLTFRIVNPENGRVVYAGIREFSAREEEVGLSSFLTAALGLGDGGSPPNQSREETPTGDIEMAEKTAEKFVTVIIHAKELPKGRYVRLRPLEAGYDPEDWKSLLERYLRDNFTTLTNGEILEVPVARNEKFKFLVDKFEPECDGICIVDTDLEVDIEPLNEEQARETLTRRLAKAKRGSRGAEGSSTGGNIKVEEEIRGQVLKGDYVDFELKDWDRKQALDISLETSDEISLDLFVSPFSSSHRSKPREDEHVFGDLGERPSKRLRLSPANVELKSVDSLYISIHAWNDQSDLKDDFATPIEFTLNVGLANAAFKSTGSYTTPSDTAPDEVMCKNCLQSIPKRTLPLHEAFCYRNNILCPKGCGQVFLKSSGLFQKHWHCSHDTEFGNSTSSRTHHNSLFHPASPLQCASCDFEAFNIPILADHRTSSCPGKEILCQYCHLIVPQQGPEDPAFTDAEVILSGLTPHEFSDGARTTECHLCGKIVRLRDMTTHLRLHDRERLSRPKPMLCVNSLCGRTVKPGDEFRVQKEQLGLCNECFGPLYVASYDPEGKALRRRIERRLLQQLMAGCGKPWCQNADLCKSGHKNSTGAERVVPAKDALPLVKPIMAELEKGNAEDLRFCVDEASQRRRLLAEMMAGEGTYELAWCVKGLEEGHVDVARAREWLEGRAPRIGEVAGR